MSTEDRYTRQEAERDLAAIEHGSKSAGAHEWLRSRPAAIQSLYHRYPPTRFYRVKPGAPYQHTGPGCVGLIRGYQNDLWVVFSVLKDVHGYIGYTAEVDPKWLEPVTVDTFPITPGDA